MFTKAFWFSVTVSSYGVGGKRKTQNDPKWFMFIAINECTYPKITYIFHKYKRMFKNKLYKQNRFNQE